VLLCLDFGVFEWLDGRVVVIFVLFLLDKCLFACFVLFFFTWVCSTAGATSDSTVVVSPSLPVEVVVGWEDLLDLVLDDGLSVAFSSPDLPYGEKSLVTAAAAFFMMLVFNID